jgi:hypothetical protein
MSTPIQHDALDPKSLQYYAPRKSRHIINDPPSIQPLADASGLPAPQVFDEWRTRDGNAPLAEDLPGAVRRVIDEEYSSRSDGFARKRPIVILASLAAAAAVAVAITFLDTAKFAGRVWPPSKNDAETSLAERLQAANTALNQVPQKAVAPTLVVADGNAEINTPLPLGVEVTNYTAGTTIYLSGLLAGSVLSTGAPSGEGLWHVAVDDVSKTRIIPPRDFVGPITIFAELRGGNGQAIVRSPVRYYWRRTAADSEKPAGPMAEASAPAANSSGAPRKIEPGEAAALLKRAEELAANGDLPAARLLMQRVAESHNARAAYELGATYDPTVIKALGGSSASPDLALARAWYQKARDWGSSDASAHLEALASASQ